MVPNFFQFSMILIGAFLLNGCNQPPDSRYPDSQYQCEGELTTIHKDETSSIKRVDHPVFFQIKNDKISLSGIADISIENQKTCPKKTMRVEIHDYIYPDISFRDQDCEGKTLILSFYDDVQTLKVAIFDRDLDILESKYLLHCEKINNPVKQK